MRRKKHGCLKGIFVASVVLCIILASIIIIFLKMDMLKYLDQTGISIFEKVPYQETKEDIEDSSETGEIKSLFYYELLSDEEKMAYREISTGLEEQKDNIYIHCEEPETANRLLRYVLRDNPQYFWCDGSSSTTSYEKLFGEETYSVITPEYNCSKEERLVKQKEIDDSVSEILRNLPSGQSEYDKILFIYEYVINNTDYDKDAADNQNIYSVFVRHASVCAGYTKSVQYLLQKVGVYAVYVTGTTKDGSLHAWNIVKCNDRFYHLDATWGDPVYQQTEELKPTEFDNITYDYMCCDDENIMKTHQPDREYPYPECDSMEYNYYVVQGMYYDYYDRSTVLTVMNNTMYERKNPTVFKFSNREAYVQARDAIIHELYQITAQNFCLFYGISEARFFYQDEDELNKFTLYWEYP